MPNPKNKKFIAQREKEERQKRFIMIGTIAVLAIVVGLVVYGLVTENVLKPNKPVLELESYSISRSEFNQRVRYQRLNMVNQAIQMYQYGMTDYVAQMATGLQPVMVGQQTLESLKEELIILVEADKLGIELSEDDFEKELQQLFGYYADGTPTPAPTLEVAPTSTLTSQQLTLVPNTATPTTVPDTATPTTAPDAEEAGTEEEGIPTATPTEAVEEEGVSKDPTATPILQPTEYTYEVYLENYKTTLDNLSQEIGMEEDTLRNLIKAYIIRNKVMEVVTADVEETADYIWARHILVEDEETAQEVIGKLEEGSDFAELAKEYSTGPSATSGGDLGWFMKKEMVEPFAEAAFALEIGEISEPVKTSFGWHVIQTLGHEERTLTQDALDQQRADAFNKWLSDKQTEYADAFVIDETWPEDVPSEPALPAELLQALEQQGTDQLLAPEVPTPEP